MFIKKKVGKIRFEMLSPTTVRNLSAVEVIVSELYDQDGFPVEGGLMDPKMGVVDPGLRCRTCGSRVGECPGHFGHIELERPVVHVRYAKKIYRTLSVTCQNCGKIRLKEDILAKYKKRFDFFSKKASDQSKWNIVKSIYKLARKAKSCPHCDEKTAEIEFDKPSTYYMDGEKMMPIDVRDWLEKIPNEHLIFLGFNSEVARPEWSILTALPVPPVTVRPSITLETGERAEDDLTHKLVDIMRINMRLKENMSAGAPAVIVEDLWELLQYHVTTFIDNNVSNIPPARHRAGRVLNGLTQRIKSKQGRFRHNLSGKRVNFSARTVISPDSRIAINEVGIPREMALELTVPEFVTEKNVKWLKGLIMNGPESLEGANYVLMPDGRRKKITDDAKEQLAEELSPGMIVERHLIDGDIALFNRQPSLHRLSIMAHFVRVLPGHSFRLNPAICPPYNADFDGDEMNLHIPQTHESRVEAQFLMAVQHHLRSPRFGGPIIGGYQDHLAGSFLLTRDGTTLSKERAAQLLAESGVEDVELKKKEYTGKEIFSMILPKDLNIEFKSKVYKSKGEKGEKKSPYYVIVKDGELKQGVIDEVAIGAFSGKILDTIIQEYGPDEGTKFLNRANLLALNYLRSYGLSVGTEDFTVPKDVDKNIQKALDNGLKEADKLVEKFEKGDLSPWPGLTARETLESEIMAVLNKARDDAVEIVRDYVTDDNPAVVMAITGARGKVLNIAQMAACLGQQAVGGGRVKRGYEERSLPHFKKGDVNARSKGFVRNAYGTGLDPFEYFWVAMAGREGLTDTSMRTPKSGYMYRRLANALQDLKVFQDSTVRDNRGTVIQFLYGEDGIDPTKSDWGEIDIQRAFEKVEGEK
jgi:DNA-directed RNA polymerase subunit A'